MSHTHSPVSRTDNFHAVFQLPWEHAFNKFGFEDGSLCMTDLIAEHLENIGYEVTVTPWGIHNDVITSILISGEEMIPEGINLGYDTPRGYLPAGLINDLDMWFYP